MLVALGILPAATFLLVAYLVRPRRPTFAPVRLALARAAVLVGGAAAVLVEGLSTLDGLTTPVLVSVWSVAAVAAATGAVWQYRTGHGGTRITGIPDRMRLAWSRTGRVERALLAVLAVQILAELVLAVASPPNNYDSQTYHLPRIEHWVAQHNVALYPSSIDRQVAMSPGAEYLLLHLRLLTGADAWYNLVQLGAGIGCALLASRIAGQLGGSNRAAILTAFVVASTPMVALESTSTQTDLVVALWVIAVATLVLDEIDRRTSPRDIALIGGATGLTVLTKANGALAAVPLVLLWLIAQARRGGFRALGAGGLATVLALVIAGPYLVREWVQYGDPRGAPYQRDLISMQRHDPPAVLVNALRIGQGALQIPISEVNQAAATGIDRLSRTLGVDPNDQRITFWGSTFPTTTWMPDEDKASFPVEGILVLCGAGVLLFRPRGRVPPGSTARVRGYAGLFWLALLIYVGTVKWQPWGNRLILYLLVLGAPLAGLWVESLLPGAARAAVRQPGPEPSGAAQSGSHQLGSARPGSLRPGSPAAGTADRPVVIAAQPASTATRLALKITRPAQATTRITARPATRAARITGTTFVALALVLGGSAGLLSVGYGWPRRLVGQDSIFTETTMQARFQRRPQWQAPYEWAAAAVRSSGAHRVGLVEGYDSWEYPWWLLLPGDQIVSLRSLQQGIPPARPESVDAILCVSSARLCRVYAPPGWTIRTHGDVGYVVPSR